MHFVITYDERAGRLVEAAEFHDRRDALRRRRQARQEHPQGHSILILSGPNRQALEKTHGRYFREGGPSIRVGKKAIERTEGQARDLAARLA